MSTPIDVTVTNGELTVPAPTPQAFDAPYISFPPFPTPPPGAAITPFKSFKPAGIHVVSDPPPDHVERDALGVPTVELRVKHSLTEMEQKKKRKPKTTTAADGTVRRLTWWEDWETNELTRRTTVPIDPSLSRVDRLHQASQDFKSGRTWPSLTSGVPQLWDAFRLYIGIISSIHPPISNKRMQQMQAAQAVAEEDSEDDDEAPQEKAKEQPIVMVNEEQARVIQDQKPVDTPRTTNYTEEERQARKEYFREAKELRMDAFFNNTEENIKIFLSSYFRDKGLIWSESRVRDAPILIGFFLNFLLRNRILHEPEHEKSLRRALVVVDQARKELPATFVIGKALPDPFSAGCEELWGHVASALQWQVPANDTENRDKDGSVDERDAKRQKVDHVDAVTEAVKEAVGETNVEVITPDVVMGLEKEVRKENEAADANANGASNADWGDLGGSWGDPQASGGWGEPGAGGDSWQDTAGTWDTTPTPNPLMSFLGPTLFPLTHTTGAVERSTRRIVLITPAPDRSKQAKKKVKGRSEAEKVEDELQGRMAKMVLAPWARWGAKEWSDVMKPEMLAGSRGPAVKDADQETADTQDAGASSGHNPYKDEITLLVDPSVVSKMVVGMGLAASWVQIVRQDLTGVNWMVENEVKKKGKDWVGDAGEATKFWYMEQLIAILPSFHTEY